MPQHPSPSANPAMIPWVIALVLSLCWANAMPDLLLSQKNDLPDQASQFQAGDHTPTPDARVLNPHLVLGVPPGNAIWLSPGFSLEFGVNGRRDSQATRFLNRSVRGRAPPHRVA